MLGRVYSHVVVGKISRMFFCLFPLMIANNSQNFFKFEVKTIILTETIRIYNWREKNTSWIYSTSLCIPCLVL
jgi:hypothetical protein